MLVSEAIGQDHQYLDECYENLQSANSTGDEVKWRNMLTCNLARHAISEELTVYPAMEKWLGEEGKALTKEDFVQHQAVT
jgi:hemerythrin superfamily protein